MKELLVQLQAQKDELDSICEQEIQMIKALD